MYSSSSASSLTVQVGVLELDGRREVGLGSVHEYPLDVLHPLLGDGHSGARAVISGDGAILRELDGQQPADRLVRSGLCVSLNVNRL